MKEKEEEETGMISVLVGFIKVSLKYTIACEQFVCI